MGSKLDAPLPRALLPDERAQGPSWPSVTLLKMIAGMADLTPHFRNEDREAPEFILEGRAGVRAVCIRF
jgi:hypothetical protein